MDTKTPFGNIQIPFINLPKNGQQQVQQQGQPELPKLPFDLDKLTNPGNLLDKATATYCATQHSELYLYAAAGGAAASGVVLFSLIGLVFLVGKLVSTVRGRS